MHKTYRSVFTSQNSWSPQRIAACKMNKIDMALGIKMPALLSGSEQGEAASEATTGPNNFENRTALDILTFGE